MLKRRRSPGEPSLVSQPSAASPARGGWAAGLRQTGSFSYRLIAGSMGTGKTTTMAEASDLLAERGIPQAAIDVDALGFAHVAG
jgi:hypothetical protein